MSTRITVTYPATVSTDDSGTCLPAEFEGATTFHELSFESFLHEDLLAAGLCGGDVTGKVSADQILLSITFWAPSPLPSDLRTLFLEDLSAQITDGLGENGFPFLINDEEWIFKVAPDHTCVFEEEPDERLLPEPPFIAIAAKSGDTQRVIDTIRDYPATINRLNQEFGALHYAIWLQRDDLVQLLLAAKANPNLLDVHGRTPLVACAGHRELSDVKSCQIAQMLLDAGGDPRIKGELFGDALESAASKQKSQLVKLLEAVRSRD